MDFSNKRTSAKSRLSLTRKVIVEIIRGSKSQANNDIIVCVEEHLSKVAGKDISLSEESKEVLRRLIYKIKIKLNRSNRMYERFLEDNKLWLDENLEFLTTSKNTLQVAPMDATASTSKGKVIPALVTGRPSTSFTTCSDRTKRRRTQAMRETHDTDELAYALQMSYRSSGNLDAAKVTKDIAGESNAEMYRMSLSKVQEIQMSADEALSLIIECKLSKNMYNTLRASSVLHNCKLYPPYKYVLQSKKECYPSGGEIRYTECSAEVNLQALLDHTVQRTLSVQKDVVCSLLDDTYDANLICKWGCDGTSGQSTFKQKFDDDADGTKTDANIFFVSLVPLQLLSVEKSTQKQIVLWKNPRPSSPRYCRPLQIKFLHETAELTRDIVADVEEQVKKLTPFQSIVAGRKINVTYRLSLTMIDGKVCNALTSTSSSQRCYLCDCTSRQFNDINLMLTKPIKEQNLQFGISSLHAWIRFFECLLHISYRLDVKKWQNRGDDKCRVDSRKKNIQQGFRQQLGLLVDMPKQGYGSTNDGNTARRFFENADVSSSITGLDIRLIKRFHVVLQVISCGFAIDIEKYQEYCIETANMYVLLYPWFCMPTTVHKILLHSSKIIEASLLPIGQMSEEAQESCNKFIKKYRQDFARKSSRIQNMQDVFQRLMVASDPLITSLRKLPLKKLKTLDPETVALLKVPTADVTSSEDEPDHSSGDDY